MNELNDWISEIYCEFSAVAPFSIEIRKYTHQISNVFKYRKITRFVHQTFPYPHFCWMCVCFCVAFAFLFEHFISWVRCYLPVFEKCMVVSFFFGCRDAYRFFRVILCIYKDWKMLLEYELFCFVYCSGVLTHIYRCLSIYARNVKNVYCHRKLHAQNKRKTVYRMERSVSMRIVLLAFILFYFARNVTHSLNK